jgi:hypothetical protein
MSATAPITAAAITATAVSIAAIPWVFQKLRIGSASFLPTLFLAIAVEGYLSCATDVKWTVRLGSAQS